MKLTSKTGATILTIISAVGVVATAILSGKETLAAEKALNEAKTKKGEDLKPSEIIKTAAPKYIWTGVSAILTIAATISSDILNKRSIAKATAAAAALGAAYRKFREKAKEEGYLEEIDKALAKEQIESEPSAYPNPEDVDGQICCFRDSYAGRRIYATMTDFERARKQAIDIYNRDEYISIEDVFYLIAIDPKASKEEHDRRWKAIGDSCFPTDICSEIGWSHNMYEQYYGDDPEEEGDEFDMTLDRIGNDELGIPVYNIQYSYQPEYGYFEY